jgi:hypothetical protein
MLTSGYRSIREKRRITGRERFRDRRTGSLGAQQVPGRPGQVGAHASQEFTEPFSGVGPKIPQTPQTPS